MSQSIISVGSEGFEFISKHFISTLMLHEIRNICESWIIHKSDNEKDLQSNFYDLFWTISFQKFDLQIINGCYICLFNIDKINMRISIGSLKQSSTELKVMQLNSNFLFNKKLNGIFETEFTYSKFKYCYLLEQLIDRGLLMAIIIEHLLNYSRDGKYSDLLEKQPPRVVKCAISIALQNILSDFYDHQGVVDKNSQLERDTNIYNGVHGNNITNLTMLVQELRKQII